VNTLKSNLQRIQLESQGHYRKVNDLENQIHLLEEKLSETEREKEKAITKLE
jgi:chromosome segregation ATPase